MTARVLFLNHAANMGGAEFGMFDVAKSLRANAVAVLLEDGPYRELLESSGVAVRVVDAGAIHNVRRESRIPNAAALRSTWKAARTVATIAKDFDVIDANSQKAFIVGSIASRLSGTPLLWHLHDIVDPPAFSRLNILADRLLTNFVADRVVCVSKATADALIRQGGDPDRVHVVYNGVDAVRFDALAAAPSNVRESLGLMDVPVVGCFSRLAKWKGQHVLVEAASAIPNLHVLLVGGSLFGEQAYEAQLRALVESRGMRGRVHFLGQRSDVAALMQCVDMIVHPSTEPEPFARTLIESMLSGRAPIASACGGVPELIESGRNGFLFPPSDVAELRAILQRLLASPHQLARMASAARAHARDHFGVQAYVDGMTKHLNAAAASRPRARVPAGRAQMPA